MSWRGASRGSGLVLAAVALLLWGAVMAQGCDGGPLEPPTYAVCQVDSIAPGDTVHVECRVYRRRLP